MTDLFHKHVYDIVRLIPEGRVTSYGAIAKSIGAPQSSRQVGRAMSESHALVEPIPAHRVVNRIGMLTGKHHFSYPSQMQELLEAEGVMVRNDQVVEFKERLWDPLYEVK